MLFASLILLGSISLSFANDPDNPSLADPDPDCVTYCTNSDDFNCQIRRVDSVTTCFFKKVKKEFGGVN